MVDGWEVRGSVADSDIVACFVATPNTATPANIQDIIFANDIANGCQNGGFVAHNLGGSTTFSYDYVNFVGDIAFNATQTSNECDSGISVFEPIAADYNIGTHIYIAGSFSYGNVDPSTGCAGTMRQTARESSSIPWIIHKMVVRLTSRRLLSRTTSW